MSSQISIYVSYSQLAVFDPSLQNPFNDWEAAHVSQGFSWRSCSVSFRTLEEAGYMTINVQISERVELLGQTIRAIQVPFEVGAAGIVEVSSITDGTTVEVPPNSYALVFEHGVDDQQQMWSRISFVPTEHAQAQVLRRDQELNPPTPLVMRANPA